MLRTPASNLLRRDLVRSVPSAASRAYSTQALSNPTLKNIEKRWEGMPLQEQADLWMALRDRMKGSWSELTLQEKKAGRFYHFLDQKALASPRKYLSTVRARSCSTTRLATTDQTTATSLRLAPSIASCVENSLAVTFQYVSARYTGSGLDWWMAFIVDFTFISQNHTASCETH